MISYNGSNVIQSLRQYEMFANSNVNVTTKSTFSTYFSLFKESDNNLFIEFICY